jgi:hypothetical protein
MKAASIKISLSSLTSHLADLVVIALTSFFTFFKTSHCSPIRKKKEKILRIIPSAEIRKAQLQD